MDKAFTITGARAGIGGTGILLVGVCLFTTISWSATIWIDLDRSSPAIDSVLDLPVTSGAELLQGAVVVTGEPEDVIGANILKVIVTNEDSGGQTIEPSGSMLDLADVPPGVSSPTAIIGATSFQWIHLLPAATAFGSDGLIGLLHFDLLLVNLGPGAIGNNLRFSFEQTENNQALGLSINGSSMCFGDQPLCPAIPEETALIRLVEPPPTQTATSTPLTPVPTATEMVTPTASPTPPSSPDITIWIDLDREEPGIQSDLSVVASLGAVDIKGTIAVTGNQMDQASASVVQVDVTNTAMSLPLIDAANSNLEVADIGGSIFAPTYTITDKRFIWINALPILTALGSDNRVDLCHFNIRLVGLDTKKEGDTLRLSYGRTADNPALGLRVNEQNFSLGPHPELPAIPEREGFIHLTGDPTVTPSPSITETPTITATPSSSGTPAPTPSLSSTQTSTTTPPPTASITTTVLSTGTPTESATLRRTAPPSSTPTPTSTGPTPTQLPTRPPPQVASCTDSGFYVFDVFGNRHPAGSPPEIGGTYSLLAPDGSDMERTASGDIGILDRFGIVTYLMAPGETPQQSFGWLSGGLAPCGDAVDVEISSDGLAFWVLTQNGGIYRGGNAVPAGEDALLGNDATQLCSLLGVPYGEMRNFPFSVLNDDAIIAAVGFVVIGSEDNQNPVGFIVLDSQGGNYKFDGQGRTLDKAQEASRGKLLDPETVFPFFPGLDIARDIEIHPHGDQASGLVILDGWGGIHPVPVDQDSEVSFLTNKDFQTGVPLFTVGLPYVTNGFDDPATPGNEDDSALYPPDTHSVFRDIEFCTDGSQGVHVLDRFGAVFAFGSTRTRVDSNLPAFDGNPLFFPFKYAQDLEGFPSTER